MISSFMIRGIKRTAFSLLLLLLLIACLFWWGFSTSYGTQQILSATQSKLQNVSYEYVSGNLMEGLVLQDAEWQLKNGTVIHGDNLRVFTNPTCWKRKKICIDNGSIDRLTIKLPAKKNSSEEIKLNDLSLLLAIETSGIRVDELVFAHPSGKPMKFLDAEFSGNINESRIKLDQFTTKWNQLYLSGSGTLTMQNHYPINISGTASRSLGNSNLHTQWLADGNLKLLNLRSDIVKPFNATLSGTISLLNRRKPANLTLQWQQLDLPFGSEDPPLNLSNGSVDISGDWPEYNVQGNSKLHGPNLPSGTANLAGTLSVGQLNFNPLTINTLEGHLVSTGEFSWSEGMRWNATYRAENLNPAVQWDGFNGSINGTGTLAGMIGKKHNHHQFNDININGTLNGSPVTASGNIGKDKNGWSIGNMQLNSNDNNISANGAVDDSVKVVFSVKSAEKLIADAEGDLHGDLTISGEFNKPTIEGSVTTSGLHFKNIDLKNARLNGIIRNLGHSYSDIQFQASALRYTSGPSDKAVERELQQPVLKLHGELSDHILELKLSTDPLQSIHAGATGAMDEHYNWNGSIDHVTSNLAERTLSLAKPFPAVWIHENKTLAVEPNCWRYDFASVCVTEPALIGDNGLVKFALNRLPLESITEFIPNDVQLSGILRSKGELVWGPNQKPGVTVDSHLDNATLTLSEKINNKQLKFDIPVAKLNIATEGYKISSKLQMASDKFANISAEVDLYTAANSYPIKGKVNLSDTELDWIKDFLPDINLLNGTLGGEARVAGTLKKPSLRAQIRLKNGQVNSELLPINIKDIEVNMDLADSKAVINGKALANDKEVAITGEGSLSDQGLSSDLQIAGKDIRLQHKYAENVVLSPDLTFSVRKNKIDIAGTVDVPQAKIALNSLSTDGVILSDDVIITDDIDTETAKSTVGSTGINTRVRVSLGEEVSVIGHGLTADLSGDFTFALASEKPPSLAGQISVSNGDYSAYGQKLKIRDGVVTFTGPVEQTALSVEAVREIKDVLAGVRIKGTLQNPTTALFSEPPLPEEEILPYIVLGRKLDLNDGDTGLLRKAALLLGVNTGQRVSSGLARSLGIDDFSLSAWGTGDDTQILVSGKLTDRLLLRYGVGVFKDSNTLYLRYDLAEKLYLETTQGLESAVDLFYSFDF